MSDRIATLAAALADRYRIERELGQGGMATVFLADDLKHDRKVALKVLKPELAAVLGAERFVVEIKTTASLQHPHILPLFDSGTAQGFLYYVMPFIEGETLRDKLSRETQLAVPEAVKLAVAVADALDYAHRHGVIHRDIKPENILLHDGRPMVADFGIALAVSAAAGGRMTETGLSLGTPHYMSPEQATADKEISARSDIYSIGSVLYEMLTGSPPHTGASAQQIIMKIIAEPAEPVTKYRKAVPAHVAAAVAQSLEKLPADRFESAKAFAAALENPHFTGSPHPTTAQFAPRVGARAARVAVPWAIAGIAAAVATGLALRGERRVPEPPMRFALTTPGVELSDAGALAISRDGRTIVFAGTTAGVKRLYARRLDDPVPRPLAGTEGAIEAAISPDARWVVFASSDDRVKKVALEGGSVETLVRTTRPAGITWSEKLGPVLGMPLMSSKYQGLTTIPPRGDSTLARLTLGAPDPGRFQMHHWPVALGDGNTIVYADIDDHRTSRLGVFTLDDSTTATLDLEANVIAGVAGDMVVYIDRGDNLMAARVDLEARRVIGVPVRIPTGTAAVSSAALSPTGTLVIRLAPSAYQAVLVDERGGVEPLLPDTVSWLIPRFAPDGRRIAFDADFRRSGAVWLYDGGARALSKLNDGKRSAAQVLHWSSDGSRVLNATGRGSRITLEWIATDAARPPEPVAALSSAGIVATAAVSPDQRTFAIGTAFGAGGANVVLRRLGSDSAIVPFVATEANEIAPRFSPDGRWIAYASDEPGRYEVYAKPFPGPGARVQISDAGGAEPVWARDGRRLFYRSGRAMIAAHLERGGRDAESPGVLAVSRREQLFTGEYYGRSNPGGASYDVSPDGRRFVMARSLDGTGAQLVVWTAWLPEVRGRLRTQP
jgi:Tol biopolymer transport system component